MASQKGKTQNYRLIFVGDEIWHQEQYETWLPFIKRLEQDTQLLPAQKFLIGLFQMKSMRSRIR